MSGAEMISVPREWLLTYLEDDAAMVYVDGNSTSLWELLSNAASRPVEQHQGEPVAVDWEGVRQNADRYLWLRNHAVRIQGSQMWYQGAALDIRVDVGRDRMAEQARSVQEGGVLLLRHQPE